MTLDEVKRDVAIANRVLWATGLCAGITTSLGHASRAKGQPRVGGLWQYYTAEVSRDL